MGDQLQTALAGWGLAAAECERLAGDVSHRRFYRVRHDALAGSAVAMVTPPDLADTVWRWLAVGEHLRGHGVPVPAVLRADLTHHVLLLEDVGDRLLAGENPLPVAAYEATLAHLARLERQALHEPDDVSPAHARRLEPERIRWEIDRFRNVVLGHAPLDADEMAAWERGEAAMVSALTAAPQVWMHRDLHARNLLLHGEDTVWIDFQDAMRGPWLYDLASLLYDPYVPAARLPREALRQHYLALPERVDFGLAAAEVEALYHTAATQRLLHCVACYAAVHAQQGRELYLRYLPQALTDLRAVIAGAPAAAPLAALLAPRWTVLEGRWIEHAASR